MQIPTGRTAVLVASLIALSAVAACQRKQGEAPTNTPAASLSAAPPASSAAPPPLSFQQTSPAAEVSLKLPAELQREPELHAKLYAAEVKALRYFAENAKAEFAEMGEQGSGALPSEKREDWSVAADTSKLLSLKRLSYEFETGGAHPNLVYGAILWDRALKRTVPLTALFRSGADLSAVQVALCDGIRAESRARFGALRTADDTGPSCPSPHDLPFVLTPSTEPGKAAGLTFLVSPYALGSMAEGPYEVTVPLPVFQKALSPAYADEFAGQPVKPKAEAPQAARVASGAAQP